MGIAVAGVVVIFALGLAYLSFKTWRIAQVLTVVFICFGASVNFYLATMTLKVHDAWRKRYLADVEEVKNLAKEHAALLDGEEEKGQQLTLGINQVQDELYRLALDRGGIYYDVELSKIDAQTGAVTTSIAKPTPHGLVPKQIVFAFEQAHLQDGGHYMGEFKVVAAPDMSTEVELAPNVPLTPNDLRLVTASKGPWVLYLIMPLDNPAVAASAPDDVKNAVAGRVPADFFDSKRKLHDYEFGYHEYIVQTPLLRELIARQKADIAKTEMAQQKAQTEKDYRDKEKAALEEDLTRFKNENQVVAKYEQTLNDQLTAVRTTIRGVYFDNKRLAEDLTNLQLKAAEDINRRTGVAQAASPGPALTGQP